MSVNNVQVLGYVGQNPELRRTSNDRSVTNFTVATNESFTKDGEKQERTEWHTIVVWNKLAELVCEYVAKGSQVYVEGKLQTESYDKEGVTHYQTKIIAHKVDFLGGRRE